jgi:hypothetical protein
MSENKGCNCGNPDCLNRVKFDGSGGIGDHALLTIYTKDDIQGEKEETFEFPYSLINLPVLNAYQQLRQITGYKLIRLPAPPKEDGQ